MFHETTIQATMPITSSSSSYSPSNPCFQISPWQTQDCRALTCSFCVPVLSRYSWLPTELQLHWVLHMQNKQRGTRMVCNNSSIIIRVLKKQHKIQPQGTGSKEPAPNYYSRSQEMSNLFPINDGAELDDSSLILLPDDWGLKRHC